MKIVAITLFIGVLVVTIASICYNQSALAFKTIDMSSFSPIPSDENCYNGIDDDGDGLVDLDDIIDCF